MTQKGSTGRHLRPGRLLVCIMSLALILSCVPVMAAKEGEKGSITVDIKTAAGKAVGGGELTLYKVADAKKKDADKYFEYRSDFKKSFEDNYPLNDTVISEDSDKLGAPALAQKLADFIANNKKISALGKKNVGTDGQAVFDNLEEGQYLVVQTKAAKGYKAISPFVITVPRNKKNYNVNANPKLESATTVVPPEPSKRTEIKTPQTTTPQTKLPQTGQYWWPVPILLAAGALSLISGLAARRRSATA